MVSKSEPLPDFMTPTPDGKIHVTGKWLPNGRQRDLVAAWHGLPGAEIFRGVGSKAILVHEVFDNQKSARAALAARPAIRGTGRPQMHLIRGKLTPVTQKALADTPHSVGAFIFGYELDGQAVRGAGIEVTAKWTCHDGAKLADLEHWWRRVGIEAHETEKGLVRFQVYRVEGEKALIIHETFRDNAELKFHLSKGTAAQYKPQIDAVAFAEAYYFRGPVSLLIRAYSKFMGLPVTFSNR